MPGEPYDADLPELAEAARQATRFPPIYFCLDHAKTVLTQFQETADHRGWLLLAVAIMTWHFHLVVGVEGDPNPHRILGDFKSYASRALNRKFGKPASDTWWTTSGSKRKLKTGADVAGAVCYVQEQECLCWCGPTRFGRASYADSGDNHGEPETLVSWMLHPPASARIAPCHINPGS